MFSNIGVYMHFDNLSRLRGLDKIQNCTYIPEKVIEGNPMFNYLELIILDDFSKPITIERPQKFGGAIGVMKNGQYTTIGSANQNLSFYPQWMLPYTGQRR